MPGRYCGWLGVQPKRTLPAGRTRRISGDPMCTPRFTHALSLHAVVIRARYPVIIDMTGPHAAGMKLGQILNTRAILNIVTLKKGHLLSK